jgi:hypothetical protein
VPVLVLWSTAAQAVTHTVLHVSCGSGEPAPSLRVLAAHGAAVVITSVVLARADRQLWLAHVVRTALARLVLPVLVPVLPGVPRLARPQDAPLPRTDPTIRHQARRGPPAALLLAS